MRTAQSVKMKAEAHHTDASPMPKEGGV
jgi:hypothetical protein